MKLGEAHRFGLREIDLHHDEDLGNSGIVPVRLNGEIREIPVYKARSRDTEIESGFTYIPISTQDHNAILNEHLIIDPSIGE